MGVEESLEALNCKGKRNAQKKVRYLYNYAHDSAIYN